METMSRRRAIVPVMGMVILTVAVLVIHLLQSDVGDGTSYEYATLSDVNNDSSVQAASIPEFVPASAREIVGWYHVETNRQTLEFAFAIADKNLLERDFKQAKESDAEKIVEKLAKYRWKESLPSRQEAVVLLRSGVEGREYLVINSNSLRAFYLLER